MPEPPPVIQPVDPRDPRVCALVEASDELMRSLYPDESNHLVAAERLDHADTVLLGALVGDHLAAIGAMVLHDGDVRYGEIKRVFTDPPFRGRGLSKALMARLEEAAGERGAVVARLETGVSQPEALGLYRALGYTARGPFGAYAADPLSVFMEKPLTA
ncbi:MAG: GNAT family N-acetyltransferase [Thermoleophilia bacterium]